MAEYGRSLGDDALWVPRARRALHHLGMADDGLTCGVAGTFPTVVGNGLVVKFFGHFPGWRAAWQRERAALEVVGGVAGLLVPTLLGEGDLYSGERDHWPFLVMERVAGVAWRDLTLPPGQRRAVARTVGEQMRLVHSLEPAQTRDLTDRVVRTPDAAWQPQRAWGTLPAHLLDEVPEHLRAHPTRDAVFLHGDLTEDHLFVDVTADAARLSGVIDWGDAAVAERHLELGALHLGAFGADRDLLGAFLAGYGWHEDEEFAPAALAAALRHEFDLFAQVSHLLSAVRHLSDLADVLFSRSR